MPWLAVLAGALVTAGIFWKAREDSIERFHMEFDGDASLRANILVDALADRLMDLDAVRRFYQSSSNVDRQEFKGFVGPVAGTRAGVRAIAWVPRITQEERPRHEAGARQGGLTNFVFTQRDAGGRLVPSTTRDLYYPVASVEPMAINAVLLGLDLGGEAACLDALNQARDTGKPAATERLTLPLDPPGESGLILFMPVYRPELPIDTVPQRQSALQGFAVGMFRVGEVFAAALEPTKKLGLPIDFQDLSAPPEKRLVYHWVPRLRSTAGSQNVFAGYHRVPPFAHPFTLAGREWQLTIHPGPAYRHARYSYTYWAIPPLGLVMVGLLGFYLRALISHRERAENLVRERTAALEDREATLETITGSARDAILMMEADGRISFWNPAAERILGWQQSEALGKTLQELLTPLTTAEATERVVQNLDAVSLGKTAGETLELSLLTRDQRAIWAELSLSSVSHDGKGKVVVILRDVTLRKRAEERLAGAERQYHELVNNLTVGVYRNTPGEHGGFLEANPAVIAMFEAESKEAFMQRNVSDLYADPARRKEFSEKISRAGFVKNEAIELKTLQGRRFWAAISATRKTDAGGQVFFDGVIEDITDRKQAEESLQRERILLRTLIDNLPDAIYVKDAQCRKTVANRADWRNMGLQSEAEVLGKDDFELFSREAAEKFMADDQEVIRSGRPVLNREEDFVNAQGERRWLLTSKVPLRDEQGRIIGLVGVGHDITERKRVEETMQRERILLRTLIDNLPDRVYVKDSSGRKTVSNRADYRSMGVTSEADVLEKTDFESFPREIAEKFVGDDQAVLTTGQAVLNREEYYLDAQGGQRWMLTSKLPLRDEQGRIIGLVGIGRDITERRRAEEKLRLLSRAVEQSPASIIITDPQGCIEYVNPKFSEVSGYTLEEVQGKTPRILKSDRTAPEVYVRLWQTITSGRVWQGEFCNRRKNGSLFWEAASISAVTDATGLVTHFVGVKEDITEMKRAEEELRRAKEAAEAASRAKSEFLANMSHEIRTPMNGVIGMTGLLLDTELADEQREYAETIRHSGETLLALLNDVLDFSKIEAGRMDLEILDFDLRAVVEDTAEILALRAQQKGLELICFIDPPVPALLQGDPGRLRQILTNLAGNAIKFTATGEVSIRVSLEADSPDQTTLRFDVDDTGIGIASDQLGRLFTPFTQVETSTTRRFGGTGLGLSISKRLVEMMGGSIGVESCEGRGSKFWFKAVFGRPSVPAQLAWKPAAGIAGKRALVVDDNATNRRLLTVLLKAWGCDFEEAAAGHDALEKLHAARTAGKPFDLALLDMHMPEMDGEELGRRIKADPALADLPLVLLTSLSERGHSERLRQIGFAGCLTKPLKQAQLYQCIALVLAHEQVLPEERPKHFVTGQILPATSQRKCRILLAEDNVTNQKVALRILEKLGYRADAVANGREVIRALETIPYSLVLMDCQMPEMDGYEATRVIRDAASRVRSHDIPVIAMTAYAMQGDREKCLAAGMNDYIAKPVQPGELAETLARWLIGGEPDSIPAAPATSPIPDTAKEIFDEADLLRRLSGDVEVVRSISGVFVEEAARNIASLQNALETSDVETASHLAHSIKGSSANLGARALRETAGNMEKLLQSGNLTQTSDLLPQLIERFAALKRAMHHLLSDDGKGAA